MRKLNMCTKMPIFQHTTSYKKNNSTHLYKKQVQVFQPFELDVGCWGQAPKQTYKGTQVSAIKSNAADDKVRIQDAWCCYVHTRSKELSS